MGELKDRLDTSLSINGNGVADNFKDNSLFFYNKYTKSDKSVLNIPVGKMQIGGFYFIHYEDDSNWMKYSPIFTADFRKFSNMVVVFGVNFNFIPLELRIAIFDKFISKKDFENDNLLAVNYKGIYDELRRIGFEYSITEFNLNQVKLVHKISLDMVPRFLYSQHPKNKYDPDKLMQIWNAKIGDTEKRHQELVKSLISDFYNIDKEISDKYNVLEGHINRIQKSLEKYGKK